MVPIRLRHSLLRNLILAFRSLDQMVFSLGLIAAVYWFSATYQPDAALLMTACGWGGMTAMSLTTAPAVAVITPEQFAQVAAKLERWRYRYCPHDASWVAPLPRWLRWNSAKVQGEPAGDMVRLTGPRLFLKRLLPLSDTGFFVSPLW